MSKGPYPVKAVANSLLDELARSQIRDCTPMKLQKLIYFAHGWYLAITDTPLIEDDIQAWKFGPVVYPIYRAFKHYGKEPISQKATTWTVNDGKLEIVTPLLPTDSDANELLQRIVAVYGNLTPIQLSNMTHAPGTPWSQLSDKYNGEIPPGVDIPDELIKVHFRSVLSNPES